jgi:hypothetical protein
MRLQRAVGQLSLSGVSCYAVRDAVSRCLADFPLPLRLRRQRAPSLTGARSPRLRRRRGHSLTCPLPSGRGLG